MSTCSRVTLGDATRASSNADFMWSSCLNLYGMQSPSVPCPVPHASFSLQNLQARGIPLTYCGLVYSHLGLPEFSFHGVQKFGERPPVVCSPIPHTDAQHQRARWLSALIVYGQAGFHTLLEDLRAGFRGIQGQRRELRIAKPRKIVVPPKTSAEQFGRLANGLLANHRAKVLFHCRAILDQSAEQHERAAGAPGCLHRSRPQRVQAVAVVKTGLLVPKEVREPFQGVAFESGTQHALERSRVHKPLQQIVNRTFGSAASRKAP